MQKNITFYTSVGGGVFGKTLVDTIRKTHKNAELHYLIPLNKYWESKTSKTNIWLRLKMYIFYPIYACTSAILKPQHTAIISTNPFFLPLLLIIISKIRGHKTINLIFDLYPEALIFSGFTKKDSTTAKVCTLITRFAIQHADATVYLSSRFGRYTDKKYGPSRRSEIISVGSDATPFLKWRQPFTTLPTPQYLYSGHMGRLHEYKTLARCLTASELVTTKSHFSFYSSGPHYELLRAELKNSIPSDKLNKYFHLEGTSSETEWVATMVKHNIGIVTLLNGGEKTVMPSKTYSALLSGQAILAICPRESDLADLVIDNDVGWHVEPGNDKQLLSIIQDLEKDPDSIISKGRKAYKLAHANFSMNAVAKQYLELISGIQ